MSGFARKGRDTVLGMLEQALAASGAAQTEIVYNANVEAYTRFARSEIHQNVARTGGRIVARAWYGAGTGIATTSDTSEAGLRSVVRLADERARWAGTSGTPAPLPGPSSYPTVTTYHESTARLDADGRRRLAARLIDGVAKVDGLVASGNVRHTVQEFAVVNSQGVRAYAPATYAAAIVVAETARGATGSGTAVHRDANALDLDGAAARAASIAAMADKPIGLAAGSYPVIIDPMALSLILFQLSFRGLGAFGGLAAEGKRSFIAGNVGQPVAGEAFSLWDDATDPDVLPMPFDAEGTPKRRVDLIQNGRAVGVCHDSATAARAGTTSTGHALTSLNHWGPVPYSVVMAPGRDTRDSLIKGMRRGLLICRCHGYVAPLDGPTGTLSGTTRDGTFWIENGEIVAPVKNLRWTDSWTDAFKTLDGVSAERHLEFDELLDYDELGLPGMGFPATNLLPTIRLGRLRIDDCQPAE